MAAIADLILRGKMCFAVRHGSVQHTAPRRIYLCVSICRTPQSIASGAAVQPSIRVIREILKSSRRGAVTLAVPLFSRKSSFCFLSMPAKKFNPVIADIDPLRRPQKVAF